MNKITRRTLVKTYVSDGLEVFITLDGKRIKLADCKGRFELYENKTEIPILGSRVCNFKISRFAVVQCSDLDLTRRIDADMISKASAFDLSLEYERNDGTFERVNLLGVYPIEIDPMGEWSFELPQIPKFLS